MQVVIEEPRQPYSLKRRRGMFVRLTAVATRAGSFADAGPVSSITERSHTWPASPAVVPMVR